jgi:hypothetical protein
MIKHFFYLPVDFYTQADTRRRGQETAQSFQRAAEQEYPSYPVTNQMLSFWLEDKVDYGKRLSYRPTSRQTYAIVDFLPQSGAKIELGLWKETCLRTGTVHE